MAGGSRGVTMKMGTSYDVQIWLLLVLTAITAACSSNTHSASDQATSGPAMTKTATVVPVSTPVPTGAWAALLEKQPHPYTTPLPESSPTVLDGTYAKIEPKEGTPVPCRRCPDYLPEGGVWRLHLDRGVYRIYHQFHLAESGFLRCIR